MRERLIELLNKKYDHFCDQCGVNKDSHYVDNLADYLLENGVVVLPCKVGDKIYKVWYAECHNGSTFPNSYDCDGCVDECDIKKVITEVNAPSLEFIISNFMGGFKNNVYCLTREEAEKALKGGAE